MGYKVIFQPGEKNDPMIQIFMQENLDGSIEIQIHSTQDIGSESMEALIERHVNPDEGYKHIRSRWLDMDDIRNDYGSFTVRCKRCREYEHVKYLKKRLCQTCQREGKD